LPRVTFLFMSPPAMAIESQRTALMMHLTHGCRKFINFSIPFSISRGCAHSHCQNQCHLTNGLKCSVLLVRSTSRDDQKMCSCWSEHKSMARKERTRHLFVSYKCRSCLRNVSEDFAFCPRFPKRQFQWIWSRFSIHCRIWSLLSLFFFSCRNYVTSGFQHWSSRCNDQWGVTFSERQLFQFIAHLN
jgi:hypothetical protein